MAIVDGRVAANNLSSFDIAGDTALGSGYGSVSNRAMSGDANLTGEDDAFADGGRARETNLRAQKGILANFRAVAHLNEVVDLSPGLNAGLADGGAVDAGVGLYFDSVFEDRGAGLKDFVPGAAGLASEAEAVGTYDCAVLDDHVVAQLAVLADYSMSVGEKVVARLDVLVEDYVR